MTEERLDIDQKNFDWIVLGTDLSESVLSACLANREKKVINIECDRLYSGTLKSLNIKELHLFIEEKEISKDNLYQDKKIEFFQEDLQNFEQIIEKIGFRGFNFDLDTKFIYSNSFSTSELINIGIDNYLTFTSLKKIYQLNNDKVFELPMSKEMIFSSNNLSLKQKKIFLERLDIVQKFIQYQYKELKNENSTNEFEKQIYSTSSKNEDFQKLSKILKENHSQLFQVLYSVEDKLFEDTLRYSIANRIARKEEDDLDLENFLRKFKDFIQSMFVHNKYPYLYPTYGISDVSQVFSRISALWGSIFLLNPKFSIFSLQKFEKSFLMKIKHEIYFYEFEAEGIIVGNEFVEVVSKHLQLENQLVYEFYQKIILLVEIEDKKFKSQIFLPLILNLPENCKNINNINPIRIVVLGENTKSTPENYIQICISYLKSEMDQNILIENILKFLAEIFSSELKKIFKVTFIKKNLIQINQPKKEENLVFLRGHGDDLTLEECFKESREQAQNLKLINTDQDFFISKKTSQNQNTYKTSQMEKELEELANFSL